MTGDYPWERIMEMYPHIQADLGWDWHDSPFLERYAYDGRDSTNAAPAYSCPYCGSYHAGMCSRVKSVEYHFNGLIKRIEFYGEED